MPTALGKDQKFTYKSRFEAIIRAFVRGRKGSSETLVTIQGSFATKPETNQETEWKPWAPLARATTTPELPRIRWIKSNSAKPVQCTNLAQFQSEGGKVLVYKAKETFS